MKKKLFTIALLGFIQLVGVNAYSQVTQLASGVKKLSMGTPDQFTPYGFCSEKPMTAALDQLPAGKLPFNINDIKITTNERGVIVEIPLDNSEQLYGFGMQIGSFNQRNLRKRPIVNDLGYTHGPATFYVSNKG
jgi:alpha-D-xyloside xylohydrolase